MAGGRRVPVGFILVAPLPEALEALTAELGGGRARGHSAAELLHGQHPPSLSLPGFVL